MEKRFTLDPLLSLRQLRVELAQAELATSERALAQQLERVAILLAIEEEAMDVLEHVLSGDPIILADVREQQFRLVEARAALQSAKATAAELHEQVESRRQATVAAQKDKKALARLKERRAEIETKNERTAEAKRNDEVAMMQSALRRRDLK